MRRTFYGAIALALVGLGVVAMVKGQDGQSPFSGTSQLPAAKQQANNAPSPGSDAQASSASDLSKRLAALRISDSGTDAAQATSQDPPARFSPPGHSNFTMLPQTENRTTAARPFPNPVRAAQATQELQSVLVTGTGQPSGVDLDPPVSSRRRQGQPTVPSRVADQPNVVPETDVTPLAESDQPVPEQEPGDEQFSDPTQTTAGETLPQLTEAAAQRQPAGQIDTNQGDSGVLMASQGPTIKVQTVGPRQISIGKAATYSVQVFNEGNVAADNVVVAVEVPKWAEVSGSDASRGRALYEPTSGGTAFVKWMLPGMAGGQSETLQLQIVPRENRAFDLSVGWTFVPGKSLTQIDVLQPRLEMSLTGPGEVLFGETKVYRIVLTNPGTGAAENVVVNLLPLVPGEEAAGVRTIGTIPAGRSEQIDIELTAQQSGDIEIRAVAAGDAGLRAESAQRVRVRRANLEMAVAGPKMKFAGMEAAYQIRVANTGDAAAESVHIVAQLPEGAKLLDGQAAESGQSQKPIQWKLDSLPPGGVRLFQVRCQLNATGDNRLTSKAMAAGGLSGAGSFATHVEALADLKLIVNDPQGPVPAGQPTIYEVKILNRGTKAAEAIDLVAFFSDGIEPIAVEGGTAEIRTGKVTFHTIKQLNAGEQIVIKITARASRPGNHTFRSELVCAAPETHLAAQETTRYYGEVTKADAPSELGPQPTLASPPSLPPLQR